MGGGGGWVVDSKQELSHFWPTCQSQSVSVRVSDNNLGIEVLKDCFRVTAFSILRVSRQNFSWFGGEIAWYLLLKYVAPTLGCFHATYLETIPPGMKLVYLLWNQTTVVWFHHIGSHRQILNNEPSETTRAMILSFGLYDRKFFEDSYIFYQRKFFIGKYKKSWIFWQGIPKSNHRKTQKCYFLWEYIM